MTPRENLWAFFKGEKYEWAPTNCDTRWFMPQELGDNVARGFVFQQTPFDPMKFGGMGWFGVDWIYDYNSAGSMEKNVLLSDISEWKEKVVFPDLDAYDWDAIREANKDYLNTDQMINTWLFTGYFERLISLLGFEEAAVSLIDEELVDYTKEFFDKLTDFYIDFIRRLKKYFNVEMLTFHDDWGSQRGLMMSKETHREMIFPYIKRIVDACHEIGVIYDQHSCGMVEDLIPAMIESGADTWMGQSCCDKKKLVDMYGDKFKFTVSIELDASMGDEAMLAKTKEIAELYKGKDVMYAIIVYGDFAKAGMIAQALRQ